MLASCLLVLGCSVVDWAADEIEWLELGHEKN
jgi:hypothetical protein